MARILLVEDDYTFRQAILDLLERFSHSVDWAESAEEALGKAQSEEFELLLSDVRIAGEADGVEGLEKIRKFCPKIRCILMTGFADSDVPLRAAQLHADDYLLKPFKMQALLQSIRKVLSFESQPTTFLMRLRSVSGQAANKALQWYYNAHSQQLQELRENGLKQFYLLIRSKRLKLEDAFAFFSDWERLELEYLRNRSPQNWAKQIVEYHQWGQRLTRLEVPQAHSEHISRPLFELFYAKVQSGFLELSHLLKAIELLHLPESRQQSLQDYCFYHWIWGEDESQGDPFHGLSIKGYRLTRHPSAGSEKARFYEAEAEFLPQKGDRVLCLPISGDSQYLLEKEIKSRRATHLATAHDHHFLLYPGYSMSLKARLSGNGLLPFEAWKLLHPVFVQVAGWHKQGRVSGSFSLQDIENPPGHPCSLSHFSPDAYREAHLALRAAEGRVNEFFAAPEVVYQAEPSPASDQAVLGRILFEVIFGGRYPEPSLRSHLRMLGNLESNQAFAPYIARLGPLSQVFYRLAHSQPDQRFADLDQAMAAGDQAF